MDFSFPTQYQDLRAASRASHRARKQRQKYFSYTGLNPSLIGQSYHHIPSLASDASFGRSDLVFHMSDPFLQLSHLNHHPRIETRTWTARDMFAERTWNMEPLRPPHHYGQCRGCHETRKRKKWRARAVQWAQTEEDGWDVVSSEQMEDAYIDDHWLIGTFGSLWYWDGEEEQAWTVMWNGNGEEISREEYFGRRMNVVGDVIVGAEEVDSDDGGSEDDDIDETGSDGWEVVSANGSTRSIAGDWEEINWVGEWCQYGSGERSQSPLYVEP